MSERLTDRDAGDDRREEADSGSAGGPPRGLTILAVVIGALLILMFVLLHLTGAIGPGAH
jgi:hypothetical protein